MHALGGVDALLPQDGSMQKLAQTALRWEPLCCDALGLRVLVLRLLLLRGPIGPYRRPCGLVDDGLNFFHTLQADRHQRLHQCIIEVLHVRRQVGEKPAQISQANVNLPLHPLIN